MKCLQLIIASVFLGVSYGEPCVDEDDRCETWSKEGECEKNPGYMLNSCKKSCVVCTPEPCVDEDDRCETWSKEGECEKNPGYMLNSCKKSCVVCTSDDDPSPVPGRCPEDNPYAYNEGKNCCKWGEIKKSSKKCKAGAIGMETPKKCCKKRARAPCPVETCKNHE